MRRACPSCQEDLERIPRQDWMRLIPKSKHYICRDCGYSYLLIFDRWLLRRHLHQLKPNTF